MFPFFCRRTRRSPFLHPRSVRCRPSGHFSERPDGPRVSSAAGCLPGLLLDQNPTDSTTWCWPRCLITAGQSVRVPEGRRASLAEWSSMVGRRIQRKRSDSAHAGRQRVLRCRAPSSEVFVPSGQGGSAQFQDISMAIVRPEHSDRLGPDGEYCPDVSLHRETSGQTTSTVVCAGEALAAYRDGRWDPSGLLTVTRICLYRCEPDGQVHCWLRP